MTVKLKKIKYSESLNNIFQEPQSYALSADDDELCEETVYVGQKSVPKKTMIEIFKHLPEEDQFDDAED